MSLLSAAAAVLGLSSAPKLVSVRFSTNDDAWVEVSLTEPGKVIRMIEAPAFLEDVKFSVATVGSSDGCGSRTGLAGLATGKLHESQPDEIPHATDFTNLGFNTEHGGQFIVGGKVVTETKWVRLGFDRFATVRLN